MAKPVTDYVINIKIKGEDNPPTATTIARVIRNKLYNDGYEATVRAQIVKAEAPITEDT